MLLLDRVNITYVACLLMGPLRGVNRRRSICGVLMISGISPATGKLPKTYLKHPQEKKRKVPTGERRSWKWYSTYKCGLPENLVRIHASRDTEEKL